MTNASHRFSDTNGFLDLWEYNTKHAVDSGGYSVMNEYGSYPWSVEEYDKWLSSQSFNWAAVMDYACEERFDDIMSVDERVDKTIENTIKHFDLDPDYNLLPVLQGRSVDKYVECYDRLDDHGIPLDKIGLGTVCRISSSSEIVQVEKELRDRTDAEWIHGFGVKINAFKLGATFESADSQAWNVAPSNGTVYIEGENKLHKLPMDDSRTRTYNSFKSYFDYVTRLVNSEDNYPCSDCEFSTNELSKATQHSYESGHVLSQ